MAQRSVQSNSPRARTLRALREWIRHGVLKHGETIPTERALSRKLKVGRATVSRALQVLQDEGLLRQVTPRTRMVSEPNASGRRLVRRAVVVLWSSINLDTQPVMGGWSETIVKGLLSGIRDAGLHALALNPDTVLPPSGLADMVHYMDADETIGVAGPKLVMLDGALDLACRRSFPSPEISFYRMVGLSKLFPRSKRFGRYNMTYLDPDIETEVDSVVGAFMMVRREAIRRVGLFDETYFMYGEDLDWAYRIKQAGWKVIYNPRVTVTHVKRAASRQSQRAKTDFYRAMLIFYRKHYRATTPFWLHSLIMMGIALKGGRPIWRDVLPFVPRSKPAASG